MKITATLSGPRIHVRGHGVAIKNLHKTIPGANFSKRANAWTLPLSMDSCRALRDTFGDSLEIADALWDWARTQRRRERRLGKLGKQLSGVDLRRIPEEYPALAAALRSRPYQAAAARFVAEARAVLIADTPGLGKTTEAIAGAIEAATEHAGPYLVCAPQTSLSVVWERELLMRAPDDAVPFVIDGSHEKRDRMLAEALDPQWDLGSTWVIINIEMIRTQSWWRCPECAERWKASDKPRAQIVDCGHEPKKVETVPEHKYPQLFSREWGGIIMDECQRSLIRTSGTPTQTRNGAILLRPRSDGVRIALSGTPMRGKPYRLWGTLNWLRPDLYTAFWSWVYRYFHVDESGRSREIGRLRKDRMKALNAALNALMIRRTKEEVSPELPPKQYMGSPLDPTDPHTPTAVWLEMTPAQARAYRQMQKLGSAKIAGGRVSAVGILAEITRLKQFASAFGRMEEGEVIGSDGIRRDGPHYVPALPSNKFDWLVQFLMERNIIDPDDEPTGKVVVVSQFTELLGMFEQELLKLGVKCLSVSGRVQGRKRESVVDAFNDPSSGWNVLFLNTKAGGVSITLDAADDMVFLDETGDPDDQTQAEDRINNRRPEERVAIRRYWYLKSLGTIDQAIAETNLATGMELHQVLDGRRGIQFMKHIVTTKL